MTGTPVRRLAPVFILASALLRGAAFDESPWKYRVPVQVPERGKLCVIPFDRTLYSRMRPDLADLRIVKAGEEVPYVIDTAAGSLDEKECRPELINKSAVRGPGVQVTLDLARCGAPGHSRLRVATGETNFRQRVRIETSDDNAFWAVVREEAYIFDFTQADRKLSVLTVDYPVSPRRFLRATVFGWRDPAAVTAARSLYRAERPAEEYIVDAIVPARIEDTQTRTSLLTLDLGQSGLPHHRVRLEAEAGASFHRAVELEASDDAKTWAPVTRGAIFQVPGEESLALSYPERHDRYLRLRIFNGDDRPAPAPLVYVETLKRTLKFLPASDGDFYMYYGNPAARLPVYDLAAILSRQFAPAETRAAVGEWRINPAWRPTGGPPRPWSDRHPALLYGALALAIAVMGLVTARFLMKVRSAT